MSNILITGGCGFLGSNLAAEGLKRGDNVTIFDNVSRYGGWDNLKWLKSLGHVNFVQGDIRLKDDIEKIIQKGNFDSIFHLSGQVAMTTSIEDPYKDFQINAMGTVNVLDSIRKYSPNTSLIYSSTNKVYGELEQFTYNELDSRYVCVEYPNGFDESTPLDFHTPYGCSKGAADQYVLDYSRIFDLDTVVFRHSSMYGAHQYATYDQGWIGWFCSKALEQKRGSDDKFTISGNGKQVRDVLHASDMIDLYYSTMNKMNFARGNAFNIGGSIENSLSLLELFDIIEDILNISLCYDILPPRANDQKVFVADISKIKKIVGWSPKVTAQDGIKSMIDWTEEAGL